MKKCVASASSKIVLGLLTIVEANRRLLVILCEKLIQLIDELKNISSNNIITANFFYTEQPFFNL